MEQLVIDIQEIAWHRNGISGLGFYAVRFTSQPDDASEPENFLATVFDEPGACAVIGLDRIEKMGVAFAQGNSWRGDNYEPILREAIEKADSLSGAIRLGPFGIPTKELP